MTNVGDKKSEAMTNVGDKNQRPQAMTNVGDTNQTKIRGHTDVKARKA